MGLIAFLLVGLIAGWLAGMAMGGRGFGILGNIVVGIVGAFVGGFVGSFLFGWDVTGFNVGSIVLAFLGAVLFLLILRAIPGTQPFVRYGDGPAARQRAARPGASMEVTSWQVWATRLRARPRSGRASSRTTSPPRWKARPSRPWAR
jgi:uncharacterized membrane protein YeaQ/YmgE (transglycosylase-associated protein family)